MLERLDYIKMRTKRPQSSCSSTYIKKQKFNSSTSSESEAENDFEEEFSSSVLSSSNATMLKLTPAKLNITSAQINFIPNGNTSPNLNNSGRDWDDSRTYVTANEIPVIDAIDEHSQDLRRSQRVRNASARMRIDDHAWSIS